MKSMTTNTRRQAATFPFESLSPSAGWHTFNRVRRAFAKELASELRALGFAAEAPFLPVGSIWRDGDDKLNAGVLRCYGYPTDRRKMPWIFRIALNYGCGDAPRTVCRRLGAVGSRYGDWRLELSVLPEEVDEALISWLARWIAAREDGTDPGPAPHGIVCATNCKYAWSPAAYDRLEASTHVRREANAQRSKVRAHVHDAMIQKSWVAGGGNP